MTRQGSYDTLTVVIGASVRRWLFAAALVVGWQAERAQWAPLLQAHESGHLQAAARHGIQARQVSERKVLFARPDDEAVRRDILYAGYRATLEIGVLVSLVAVLPLVWPAAGLGLGIAVASIAEAAGTPDWINAGGIPGWYLVGAWQLIVPVALVAWQMYRDKLLADDRAGKRRPAWLRDYWHP